VKAFTDMVAAYRELGPWRFILLVGGTVAVILAFAAIFFMFADRIGWPEAYGFQCRRKCLLVHIWHSPKLLAGGSGDELALFALIWFFPFVAAAIAIPIVARRWLKRRRGRIRSMK